MATGYSTKFIDLVRSIPATNGGRLGNQLGRLCIEQNYSVKEVAKFFGVSRVAVYRWFTGLPISPKYATKAHELMLQLKQIKQK